MKKKILTGIACINDHFDKSHFVQHDDIQSICRRPEVANDVVSGMDDTGAKTYHFILGLKGLAVMFSHNVYLL